MGDFQCHKREIFNVTKALAPAEVLSVGCHGGGRETYIFLILKCELKNFQEIWEVSGYMTEKYSTEKYLSDVFTINLYC